MTVNYAGRTSSVESEVGTTDGSGPSTGDMVGAVGRFVTNGGVGNIVGSGPGGDFLVLGAEDEVGTEVCATVNSRIEKVAATIKRNRVSPGAWRLNEMHCRPVQSSFMMMW